MLKTLVHTILAVTLAASSASGQRSSRIPPAAAPVPGRLTVRPHEMTIGTENVKAGVDTLDSLPEYFVYVPENCVGKRRVPLVVYVHGAGWNSAMQLEAQRDLANKYGMILLLPNAASPGRQDVFVGHQSGETQVVQRGYSYKILQAPNTDIRAIDAAMKQVLQKYAIDPDKIAVMGFSNGGSYALLLGRNNPDIFSRVGGLSAITPFYGEGPRNDQTRFLLSGGIAEYGDVNMVKQTLNLSKELRNEGYKVETVLALRAHSALREDDNYAWNWLARSWQWKTSGSAHEGPPRAVADSDPVLTVEALTKMTTFWSSFMNEPDSIREVGRAANQEYITMSVGQMPVTVVKVNMTAMAAKYPSVAADLKEAGLTVQQEEAYRAALIRVGFTRRAEGATGAVTKTSALGKNLVFRAAHDEAFQALAKTDMWTTQ